jgi:hypothetical protein
MFDSSDGFDPYFPEIIAVEAGKASKNRRNNGDSLIYLELFRRTARY